MINLGGFMCFNFKASYLFLILALLSHNAKLQSDPSSVDVNTLSTDTLQVSSGYLIYQIDYQQMFDTSMQRGCSESDFQHHLLYTTLYSLFIFLPLEATYHPNITTLSVEILKDNEPVLKLEVPLENLLRSSNERFRRFMHSQALRGLGNCFVATESQLEAWLLTIGTFQGSDMYYDANLLLEIENFYDAYFKQRQQVENLFSQSSQQVNANNEDNLPKQDDSSEISESQSTPSTSDKLLLEESNTTEKASQQVSVNDENTLPKQDVSLEISESQSAPSTLDKSLLEEANTKETINEFAEIDVDESNWNISVPSKQKELFIPENYRLTPFLPSKSLENFSGQKMVLESDKDYFAVLETTQGRILIDLFEEQTPITVNNFIFLALNHYYDGIPFHNVLQDFIAQTGDPTGTGQGGSNYWLELEIATNLSHLIEGVVSMAGDGNKSSSSQFFFTLGPAPDLDGHYTIFGKVTEGLDVLENLQPLNIQDEPSIFATLQDSLALLAIQGIELTGDKDISLEEYIIELHGKLPQIEERFKLDFVDAIILNDPVIDELFVAFWPMPDMIEQLYIVER